MLDFDARAQESEVTMFEVYEMYRNKVFQIVFDRDCSENGCKSMQMCRGGMYHVKYAHRLGRGFQFREYPVV